MSTKIVADIYAITVLAFPLITNAQEDRFGVVYGESTGLGTRDIRATAVDLVNAALGLLGIIFLVMILLGGLRWMTAGGNDEAAVAAKKTIGQAIVGVIVIFIAYSVTRFVFSALEQAT